MKVSGLKSERTSCFFIDIHAYQGRLHESKNVGANFQYFANRSLFFRPVVENHMHLHDFLKNRGCKCTHANSYPAYDNFFVFWRLRMQDCRLRIAVLVISHLFITEDKLSFLISLEILVWFTASIFWDEIFTEDFNFFCFDFMKCLSG